MPFKYCQCCTGFLERELKKDNIPIADNGGIPLAPLPKEMIDLEVRNVSMQFTCISSYNAYLKCTISI